ncbi:hypothetical protein P389DRAFT_210293 [Cystobasidium minutum MCA 4210]|uniref:uncharacterized protein n=1 Tax=Cystobasidium minutum MCA 4210 TaxID=1397322 RepID=UPI0034CD90A3|eukprot:jgi/Rhomi1/210293/estExt_Genemark1.C_3_t30038
MGSSRIPIPASDLDGLSRATLRELKKLVDQRSNSYTVAFFPISSVVFVVILYLNAKVAEFLFQRHSTVYRSMTYANKRTSVMYILNVIYTLVVLILQLIASPMLAEKYTVERADLIKVAATIVSLLYLFEIVYRESMRTQMLIHHSATLFAVCLVSGTLDSTHHPSILVTGLVWLFQASTEQLTFIALLMYRLKYPVRHVAWLLKVSAIQNLIPKFAFAIYVLVWWGLRQVQNNDTSVDVAYSVILFICLFTLIPVQIYGSWVLVKVADGMLKRVRTEVGKPEEKPYPFSNKGAIAGAGTSRVKILTPQESMGNMDIWFKPSTGEADDSDDERTLASTSDYKGRSCDEASTHSSCTLQGSYATIIVEEV